MNLHIKIETELRILKSRNKKRNDLSRFVQFEANRPQILKWKHNSVSSSTHTKDIQFAKKTQFIFITWWQPDVYRALSF